MIIAVLADDGLKQEILSKTTKQEVEWIWVDSLSSLLMVEADAYFDLQFENDPQRTTRLTRLKDQPVFVNAMIPMNGSMPENFIRINAWPGMLQRDVWELAVAGSEQPDVKPVFETPGWNYLIVADIPGFITARVIAMIINEAYFTFEAGISTKSDIDTAMKLGTNYPFGPFEWAERIGLLKVLELLKALAETDKRYEISKRLIEEATNKKV